MADGTTKPIEDVEIGDEVLATDPETGETASRTVTAELWNTGTKHLTTLTSTDHHPYWTPDRQISLNAEDLQHGNGLIGLQGAKVRVVAVHQPHPTRHRPQPHHRRRPHVLCIRGGLAGPSA